MAPIVYVGKIEEHRNGEGVPVDGFIGIFPDLPGVALDGDTKKELLETAWEAGQDYLSALLQRHCIVPEGIKVPPDIEKHLPPATYKVGEELDGNHFRVAYDLSELLPK